MALLAYLDAAPRRTASRARLARLLWSDVPEERARQSLRQTLHQLRRLLGESVFELSGEQVRLAGPLSSDRDAFLERVEAGDDAGTVAAYPGAFMEGAVLPGARNFDDWADTERTRLRTLFLPAAERVTRALGAAGKWADAVSLARRVRDEQPLRSSGWRALVESLLLAGRAAEAAAEAEGFARLATAEGISTDRETAALMQRARVEATAAQAGAPDTEGAFVGRERPLDFITAAWERARAAHGEWVHLHGPAGIGKTRLMAEALRRLESARATTCAVRAHPGERDLKLALAAGLGIRLRELPGASGAAPASLATLGALGTRRESPREISEAAAVTPDEVAALADVVGAITDSRPLVLAIDDLHWVDSPSRALLEALWHRARRWPLLILTGGRPGSDTGLPAGARIVALAPLTAAQTEALITSFGPVPEARDRGRLTDAIYAASEGNPLLVRETLLLLESRALVRRTQGALEIMAPEEIDRVGIGDVMDARIATLPESSRRLLDVLAIAGAPMDPRIVAQAADLSRSVARAGLDELTRLGFATQVERGFALAHDAIGEAALATADGPALHRALGRTLLENGADSLFMLEAAGRHLYDGGDAAGLRLAWLRWIKLVQGFGDRSRPADLVADFVRPDVPEPVRRVLAAATSRRWFTAAMAAASVAAILALAAMSARPGRLHLATTPIVHGRLLPTPVVEVQNWLGRRMPDAAGTVEAYLHSGPAELRGAVRARIVRGRAAFENLILEPRETGFADSVVIRFRWRKAFVDSPPLGLGHWMAESLNLRLESAQLAGQELDGDQRTVTVGAGERIIGSVDFRYTSRLSASSVLLGMSPTWETPSERWHLLWPVVTPAEQSLTSGDIDIVAPLTPGTYRIIFAVAADAGGPSLGSGIDWRTPPNWADARQPARMADSAFNHADSTGVATMPADYQRGRSPTMVGMTTILVVVIQSAGPEPQ